eukprot:scaffold45278_cov14-Tisochrysis_lutea.AAC.1
MHAGHSNVPPKQNLRCRVALRCIEAIQWLSPSLTTCFSSQDMNFDRVGCPASRACNMLPNYLDWKLPWNSSQLTSQSTGQSLHLHRLEPTAQTPRDGICFAAGVAPAAAAAFRLRQALSHHFWQSLGEMKMEADTSGD